MGPAASIAHDRIPSKLGEGGMGDVYGATGTKLNREAAIRVFPESLIFPEPFAQNLDRMTRSTREAQLLASLNRPNMAAIHIPRGRVPFVDGSDSSRAIRMRRGGSPDGAPLPAGTRPRIWYFAV